MSNKRKNGEEVESTYDLWYKEALPTMKKVLTITALSLFFSLSHVLAETQLLDQVVAVVNEEAITQSELDMLLRPIYEHYKGEYQGQHLFRKLTEARQKLLNQLIEDRLVYQEAKKEKIEVDEIDIDHQVDQFKKQFPTQKEWEEALHKQGMTLGFVRDRFRRQTMVRNLHDREIRSKVVVSPLEIEHYYREHPEEFSKQDRLKVRSITLKKNDDVRAQGLKDEEAWKNIQDFRKKIVEGADFGELAKQFSQDSHASKNGLGDWVEKGDMIPEIDDVIFKLKVGQVSEVIETSMGYHLFLLIERKEGHKRTFEEARDEIHNKLFQQKMEERFNQWMEELKQTAYISIR